MQLSWEEAVGLHCEASSHSDSQREKQCSGHKMRQAAQGRYETTCCVPTITSNVCCHQGEKNGPEEQSWQLDSHLKSALEQWFTNLASVKHLQGLRKLGEKEESWKGKGGQCMESRYHQLLQLEKLTHFTYGPFYCSNSRAKMNLEIKDHITKFHQENEACPKPGTCCSSQL